MTIFSGFLVIPVSAKPHLPPVLHSVSSTYTGPEDSNFFPGGVAAEYDGSKTNVTTDAKSVDAGDVVIVSEVNSYIIIGSKEQFDGFVFDVETPVTDGANEVQYGDGTTWNSTPLVTETEEDIENNAISGVFSKEWSSRPSDWTAGSYTVGATVFADMYFVRFKMTKNYMGTLEISQIGLKVYNLDLTINSQLAAYSGATKPTFTLTNTTSSTADTTQYLYDNISSSSYLYGFYTGLLGSKLYNYSVVIPGYVTGTGTISLSQAQTSKTLTLSYAHKLQAWDSSSRTTDVTITSAKVGTTTCIISSGDAYCPVTIGNDGSAVKATVQAGSDYEPTEVSLLSDRDSNDDAQVLTPVYMTKTSGGTVDTNEPDLTISNIEVDSSSSSADDGDLFITIKNTGDADANDDAILEVEVDGDLVYSGTIPESNLEEGDITILELANQFSENGLYEVSAEIDTDDDVDESNESNNDKTEDVTVSDLEEEEVDGIDLAITDISLDSSNTVKVTMQNKGDEDADEKATITVKIDDLTEDTETISSSYLESDDSAYTVTTDAEVDNDDDSHEVEVCIETDDDDVESDNDCRTESFGGSDADVDLIISDISLDDDVVTFEAENTGTDDIDHSVTVTIEIDNDEEDSLSIASSSLEGDESLEVTSDAKVDDDGDSHEVTVCIDEGEAVDETSESNNCRTEDLEVGASSDDKPDLKIANIYLDEDGNLQIDFVNQGGDMEDAETIRTTIEIDGTTAFTEDTSMNLDADEYKLLDAEDLLEDEGSTYEIEVCVDTKDVVDEESETNNCKTVDEDTIGDENDGHDYTDDGESCGSFTDVDSDDWFEPYVCDLYDRDVVDGKTSYIYSPSTYVTRAEFLKMVLENAGISVDGVSTVHYYDVKSTDWFYDYVTYATDEGYVEGYTDGYFRPNNYVTRAEAVTILMRVADETLYDFDESDIDYFDVDVDDWFAYAIILADEAGIVEGYSDGSFRPNNNIDRASAAKIVSLAYDEYYAD
jgi:hypothetical protein